MRKQLRHSLISGVFVTGLLAVCGLLGVLQYRWIGEVSAADRERIRQSLQADLNGLSREFNSELTAACLALIPANLQMGKPASVADVAAAYKQWHEMGRHSELFDSIALAVPGNRGVELFKLDLPSGTPQKISWPDNWRNVQARIESRLPAGIWRREQPVGERGDYDTHLFEFPLFGKNAQGGFHGPLEHSESGWLVLDLNMTYLRQVLLPELVQQHIGEKGGIRYQVVIVSRGNPQAIIYQSGEDASQAVLEAPDASVGLFEIHIDRLFPRHAPPGMTESSPGPLAPSPNAGHWRIAVRSRAGSLDAVVANTRRRNLAVTGAVFLLLIGSVAALLQFTRRAQRLARLQMDFVAGISHELRTPLSVIYGAAYNLRGLVAQNPAQVERYGLLLQQESGRLKDLVEQVLRFSSSEAGNVIQGKEPISIPTLIDQTVESSKSVIQDGQCIVEKSIDPTIPEVMGDPVALKHALQNLVSNAAKYGRNGNNWIGVFASKVAGKTDDLVEIRVSDHGPGIPTDEKDHIFDAFFRGRRAIQDQIHGTGLGLNLVKKIVEAHGGNIRVESEPMQRTDFIIRLPAANFGVSSE